MADNLQLQTALSFWAMHIACQVIPPECMQVQLLQVLSVMVSSNGYSNKQEPLGHYVCS
jgi:hypothetical protein